MFLRTRVFAWIGMVAFSGILLMGEDCAAQTGPCDPDPCQSIENAVDGTCVPIGGSCTPADDFSCDCETGFTWEYATHTCEGQLPSKTVFVTDSLHDGNLGGLAGADAICQSEADGAGLVGTYKAWLSDSTGSPDTLFARSSDPYQLVDGTLVANDWADLTDGTLSAPINTTATGAAAGSVNIWTNTRIEGTCYSTGHACDDWTNTAVSSYGVVLGNTSYNDGRWTDYTSPNGCANLRPLYCFQQ